MKKNIIVLAGFLLATSLHAGEQRQLVELPEHMQVHMLSNMRDHLAALSEAMQLIAEQQHEQAAELIEKRIGMSSLEAHGASHMAKFMPKPMQEMGTEMHRSASRLARSIQEGEPQLIFRRFSQLANRCNSCHVQYRVK